MTRQHAIYGLYLPNQPDVILYVGSWRAATLDERLRQHRRGRCRTTVKMAARCDADTSDLHMRVLAYWLSGIDPNPEGDVIRILQARGCCRWNHPHAFTTEDNQRGGRNLPREDKVRGGRIGGQRTRDNGWHTTSEAHEAHVRGGHIGGRKTSKAKARNAQISNCRRWHSARTKVNCLCIQCTIKLRRRYE